jgi:hypothetical protein
VKPRFVRSASAASLGLLGIEITKDTPHLTPTPLPHPFFLFEPIGDHEVVAGCLPVPTINPLTTSAPQSSLGSSKILRDLSLSRWVIVLASFSRFGSVQGGHEWQSLEFQEPAAKRYCTVPLAITCHRAWIV